MPHRTAADELFSGVLHASADTIVHNVHRVHCGLCAGRVRCSDDRLTSAQCCEQEGCVTGRRGGGAKDGGHVLPCQRLRICAGMSRWSGRTRVGTCDPGLGLEHRQAVVVTAVVEVVGDQEVGGEDGEGLGLARQRRGGRGAQLGEQLGSEVGLCWMWSMSDDRPSCLDGVEYSTALQLVEQVGLEPLHVDIVAACLDRLLLGSCWFVSHDIQSAAYCAQIVWHSGTDQSSLL